MMQKDLRCCVIRTLFDATGLFGTHHVQFCVLDFQHYQSSISELCEGHITHFVQCGPNVIFNFKPPQEHFKHRLSSGGVQQLMQCIKKPGKKQHY